MNYAITPKVAFAHLKEKQHQHTLLLANWVLLRASGKFCSISTQWYLLSNSRDL